MKFAKCTLLQHANREYIQRSLQILKFTQVVLTKFSSNFALKTDCWNKNSHIWQKFSTFCNKFNRIWQIILEITLHKEKHRCCLLKPFQDKAAESFNVTRPNRQSC